MDGGTVEKKWLAIQYSKCNKLYLRTVLRVAHKRTANNKVKKHFEA
jgi:hypothetical protein